MKVVVVDYGMGNLFSVCRALAVCGAEQVQLATSPNELKGADRVILPGVGAFVDGMAGLRRAGFVNALIDYSRSDGHLLGICLGMQMLMDESEEFGVSAGLGLIPGKVQKIPSETAGRVVRKLPAIGWGELSHGALNDWSKTVLRHTVPGTPMYFLHSYQAVPKDQNNLLATYDHLGLKVTAAIVSGNTTGTQFHPEKSGPAGLSIIRSFLATSDQTDGD